MMSSASSKAFSIRQMEWENKTTFPELLYVDANPILDFAFKGQYGSLNERYWKNLVKHNGMLTWTKLTEKEVQGVIHRSEYTIYAERNSIEDQSYPNGSVKPAWKVAEDSASVTDASRISEIVLSKKELLFNELGNYGLRADNCDEELVEKTSIYLYKNFGGGLDDASHVAYANFLGTNDIMSNDAGLLRYPNINVRGSSAKVVQDAKKFNPHKQSARYIDLSSLVSKKPDLTGTED